MSNELKKLVLVRYGQASFIFVVCILMVLVGCTEPKKTIELKAEITLPSRDQEIWEGDVVYFKSAAAGGAPPYSYCWDFGKTIPQCLQPKTDRISFDYEGAYRVVLTVKDTAGNKASDTVRIIVNPKS